MILVNVLVGIVSPWVNAVFIRVKWGPKAKVWFTFFLAFVFALIQCAIMGRLDGANLLTSFAIIWPVSQTIYTSVAKNLGIDRWTYVTDFFAKTEADESEVERLRREIEELRSKNLAEQER